MDSPGNSHSINSRRVPDLIGKQVWYELYVEWLYWYLFTSPLGVYISPSIAKGGKHVLALGQMWVHYR